jgi:hypothetical protein
MPLNFELILTDNKAKILKMCVSRTRPTVRKHFFLCDLQRLFFSFLVTGNRDRKFRYCSRIYVWNWFTLLNEQNPLLEFEGTRFVNECSLFWKKRTFFKGGLKQQKTIKNVSIFSNSHHLEWRVGMLDKILKGDSPKDNPYQVWFNLVWWFQRRRFKCESLWRMTDDPKKIGAC